MNSPHWTWGSKRPRETSSDPPPHKRQRRMGAQSGDVLGPPLRSHQTCDSHLMDVIDVFVSPGSPTDFRWLPQLDGWRSSVWCCFYSQDPTHFLIDRRDYVGNSHQGAAHQRAPIRTTTPLSTRKVESESLCTSRTDGSFLYWLVYSGSPFSGRNVYDHRSGEDILLVTTGHFIFSSQCTGYWETSRMLKDRLEPESRDPGKWLSIH